jgi:glycosyltransferase involved in cell wall biosynthesis
MRILLVSKALVSGAYQKKCEQIAALPGVELTVAVPPAWREPRVGEMPLERRFVRGYELVALPIALNGRHHLHFYPTLGRLVKRVQPEVFHVDEESFNLATFLALRAGVRSGARCCFYNYANIERRYPPPFSYFERYAFRHATHALAANEEAAAIIRRHGWHGPLTVIPQFGVDPALFAPEPGRAPSGVQDDRSRVLMIGYIGRLVPEKGVLDLVEAIRRLPEHCHLRIVGEGAQRGAIAERIRTLDLAGRIELHPWTNDTPAALRALDILVLPSHTTPNWKEQFGRILVEAMSCGVVVVGSSSGEIPHVISDAGLTFREGDIGALAAALRRLAEHPAQRAELAQRGRARVLTHYTQAALAQRYLAIYRLMMERS